MKTILVIDDEACVREVIRDMLEPTACRVLEADGTGSVAEMIRRERPDVILLDYLLPGTSGLQLLEAMRRAPETAAIRVILMSGLGADLHLAAGTAAAYLPKPFSSGELLMTVAEVLATKQRAATAA